MSKVLPSPPSQKQQDERYALAYDAARIGGDLWRKSHPEERGDNWFILHAYRAVCGPSLGVGTGDALTRGQKQRLADYEAAQAYDARKQHQADQARRARWTLRVALGAERVDIQRHDLPVKGVTKIGAQRGNITTFSQASRGRMRRFVHGLKSADLFKGLFVTLTYPAEFPNARTAKKHLRAFDKRMRRKYPDALVIWRIEEQDRGAPHFHLLIIGVRYLPHEWVAQAWYDICDTGDPKHLEAGTEVRRVKNREGLQAYLCKELGKVTQAMSDIGRHWGYMGPVAKYLAPMIDMLIDGEQVQRFAAAAVERVRPALRKWIARGKSPEIQQARRKSANWIVGNLRRVLAKKKACWLIGMGDLLPKVGAIVGDGSFFEAALVQALVDVSVINAQ